MVANRKDTFQRVQIYVSKSFLVIKDVQIAKAWPKL